MNDKADFCATLRDCIALLNSKQTLTQAEYDAREALLDVLECYEAPSVSALYMLPASASVH
jgi:hypothetical protein